MKKGFILLSVIFLIMFVGSANAQTVCSNSNQTILKLSNFTNAHGEIWNQTNYPEEICYDNLFGKTYDLANPQSCDGTNSVLNLSSITNAHAEIPSAGNYNVSVCYGDLVCTNRSGSCQGSEVEVVSLSNFTNAHLAKGGDYNNYLICCSSASGGGGPVNGEIADVSWRDGNNQIITESYVNRTVYLYANTTFVEGEKITFDVWEKDPVYDDYIANFYAITDSNGVVRYKWEINDTAMELSCDKFLGVCTDTGDREFYFNASHQNGASNTSSFLTVHPYEGNNTRPQANITGPVHRGIYYINQPIEFNESSFDQEGNIASYTWTIESDGVEEYTTNERSFIYNFTTVGEKTITLRVEDDKGLANEDQIGVIAIGEPGMLAWINEPFHQQIIVNNDLEYYYNASDSYVIKNYVNDGNLPCKVSIDCLAGNCPAETENVPSWCEGVKNISLNLPLDNGFSKLNFTWVFYDEHGSEDDIKGFGLVNGKTVFGSPSNNLNDKHIELKLNFTNVDFSIEKTTTRDFTLLDNKQCINDGTTWVWFDENGFEFENKSTLDTSACQGNNVSDSSDDCCPIGFSCTENGCVSNTDNPEFCVDYNDKTSCEDDILSLGKNENDPAWFEPPPECNTFDGGDWIQCSCGWNDSLGDGGECGLNKEHVRQGDDGNSVCKEYECLYTYDTGECNNGFMEININATFTPGTCGNQDENKISCEEGTGARVVSCGRPTVELPFFGWTQFFSSIILVGLIYLIMKVTRKKNSKKRK